MLAFSKHLAKLEHHLAKLLIPHHHNDHHPILIRHNSLFVLAALMLAIQLLFNVQAGTVRVLAFASSIFQSEIVSLTNQERGKSGSGSLSENGLLNQAAANKAAHMFAQNYWAHYAPDGTSPWYFFNQVGYKYVWAGENLAKDFQTSEGVVQGWMNSPSHKSNLLNKSYREIGVAVANGTLEGSETTLVVQLFGTSSQGNTATAAPPAPPTANPRSVSDQLLLESSKPGPQATVATLTNTRVSNEFSGGANLFARLNNLGWAARLEVVLLFSLFLVFGIDTIVISRRRIERGNSHSLVHALVFLVVIIGVLVNAGGKLI